MKRILFHFISVFTLSFVLSTTLVILSTHAQDQKSAVEIRREKYIKIGALGNLLFPGATRNFSNGALGGGATIQIPLQDFAHIEAGAFYLNRLTSAGPGLFSSDVLHVPALMRVSPLKFFSAGLGGYYSRVFRTVATAGAVGSPGLLTNDWGLAGVLGLDVPITPALGFLAEARATQSLASLVGPIQSWTNRDLQGLVGLRVSMRANTE